MIITDFSCEHINKTVDFFSFIYYYTRTHQKGGLKMIYGYARCSTNEELQDINRQVRELKQKGATDTTIYLEYESGTKTNRAELQKLLQILQSGDTILATEVSRITRSTKQLCEIIELAKKKKIKLVLGNFTCDCTKELDPMTEGMLKMMGVFSELERNITSQRVKSGMQFQYTSCLFSSTLSYAKLSTYTFSGATSISPSSHVITPWKMLISRKILSSSKGSKADPFNIVVSNNRFSPVENVTRSILPRNGFASITLIPSFISPA